MLKKWLKRKKIYLNICSIFSLILRPKPLVRAIGQVKNVFLKEPI